MPNANIWYRRLRFTRRGSKLTVDWHPPHGASSGSRDPFHSEGADSMKAKMVPAVPRMAFTRSEGGFSGRALVPRYDWLTFERSAMANRVIQSSAPCRPGSCVQMSCCKKWLPKLPEKANSEG